MRASTGNAFDHRANVTSFFVGAIWWYWLGEPRNAEILMAYAMMNYRALS